MRIKRIYIHNFACFSNFEFKVDGKSPILVIGKNGTGKSTLLVALMVLQDIARGNADVRQIFGVPIPVASAVSNLIRIELDVEEYGQNYSYRFAVGPSDDGKAYCIHEECLDCDGVAVFARKAGSVLSYLGGNNTTSTFNLDRNLFALSVIQSALLDDPVAIVRRAFVNMFILQPVPQLMKPDANEATAILVKHCDTFASWLLYMLSSWPAAYGEMDRYLREIFPDFKSLITIGNQALGKNYYVQFEKDGSILPVLISRLSCGEKCQLIAAAIMAINAVSDGAVCVWDEPTNYLALNEVGQMMTALCSSFRKKGQLIVTAHSDEAILRFNDESTYVFSRKTHLDPVLPPATLADLRARKLLVGDLSTALRLGGVDNEG